MARNNKQTSNSKASHAARTLRSPQSSKTAKKLAASALSQTKTSKQTGARTETLASKVMTSDKYSRETKQLAGSVLSQSNKKR